MSKVNPKKLLHSKWTAAEPTNKEKHFLIVEVEYDEYANVLHCVTEAVMSKRQREIQWRDLNDVTQWIMGWK